jgi:predicted alternative tryptophan synthase beta-subunit
MAVNLVTTQTRVTGYVTQAVKTDVTGILGIVITAAWMEGLESNATKFVALDVFQAVIEAQGIVNVEGDGKEKGVKVGVL